MGPLLLLTSTLLFSCGRAEPQSFTIREIVLSIEPNTEVARDTNVTVRCKASIAGSEHSLSRAYTIYKDGILVYTKTTSSSEDLVYPLYQARVSNTGKYKCEIDIEGRKSTSDPKKLTVTGLSVPVLHINKGVLREGEEVAATCTAPEENGSIIFYFYADAEEIREARVNSNTVEVSLRFTSAGIRKLRCDYAVLVTPDSFKSKESNNVTVSVRELRIVTVLEISPEDDVYEGDMLSISCTVIGSEYRSTAVNDNLFLLQGNNLLGHGQTKINHTMIVLAKHSGDFECRLDMGNIAKVSTKTVSVTELFSEPTLTMSPPEVFYEDKINLTCKSQRYASERLRREEVTYSIEPLESRLSAQREVGVFTGKAPPYSLNYTCTARAKGISKSSNTLIVRPKVTVSMPKIWVSENVILGKPFKVLCHSERGSLPIHYSLLRGYDELNKTVTVQQPGEPAQFTITIHQPKDIVLYMCDARNNPRREAFLSKRLVATVIVPLSEPWLTVVPDLANIAEGDRLYLICSVKGTPPITFKWYRHGNPQTLFSNITNLNIYDYQVPGVGSQHSGNYYCEASNNANKVRSHTVTIEELTCYTGDGMNYRGEIARTTSGKTCQRWSAQRPHKHDITHENNPHEGLDNNYCRNPDGEMMPWCYTTDSQTRWEYCPVPRCNVSPGPELTCYTGDGRNYRGEVALTTSGKTCQRWLAQRPHKHTRTPENHLHRGLDNNFCRNPDNEMMPWCYTTTETRWEYCPVPRCNVAPGPELTSCYTGDGRNYRGTVARTTSGKTCQRWSAQRPHKHDRTPENHPHKGLDSNYCRNPDNGKKPWCYTTDSQTRWEYCPVSRCDGYPSDITSW